MRVSQKLRWKTTEGDNFTLALDLHMYLSEQTHEHTYTYTPKKIKRGELEHLRDGQNLQMVHSRLQASSAPSVSNSATLSGTGSSLLQT